MILLWRQTVSIIRSLIKQDHFKKTALILNKRIENYHHTSQQQLSLEKILLQY